MESKFKVGDLVVFKAGGPEMLVTNVEEQTEDLPGEIECKWWSPSHGSFRQGTHEPFELMTVDERDLTRAKALEEAGIAPNSSLATALQEHFDSKGIA